MNSESSSRKKIVVVLGMHRSGTSAVTKSLEALGVQLGDNLMPPVEEANAKGYFEDMDTFLLNVGLQANLEGDWDSLSLSADPEFQEHRLAKFRLRAVELIRKKMQGVAIFGLKDPRMAMLLPFWHSVFVHMDLDINYVIVIRNPLSVAESLKRRNEFAAEKSHYLWLKHMVSAMSASNGTNRLVVNYDLLMAEPAKQLDRISQALQLPVNATVAQLFAQEFLEEGLRHTSFDTKDLALDAAAPAELLRAYDLLDRAAHDRLDVDATEVSQGFEAIAEHLQAIRPALSFMNRTDRELIAQLNHAAQMQQQLADRDSQLADRDSQLADRDSQLSNCTQQIAHLQTRCEEQESLLTQAMAATSTLEAQLADSKKQITTLQTGQSSLQADKIQLADHAQRLELSVQALQASLSWKLTAPVRFIAAQCTVLLKPIRVVGKSIALGGGVTSTVKLVASVLRDEGLKGIVWRLKNAQTLLQTPAVNMPPHTVGTVQVQEDPRNNYAEWLRRFDTLSDADRESMRACIAQTQSLPLISVVMPVYNPNPVWLAEAIDSVRQQLYPQWELCMADDCSTDPEVRKTLEHYSKLDSRIKVVFREKNGHISAASNSALAVAVGEWVALLDHDDLLPEHALYCVFQEIQSGGDVNLIYSDEDKIDEQGKRHNPYFKTDWNPDLFYSHNMFSHLGVYRKCLLDEIHGFRLGMEGSQDYDLALRCIELVDPKTIRHIPRVLYHWRVHSGSTAATSDAKPYAMIAGERAINEHFQRTKVHGKVVLTGFGYRAMYELPAHLPLVSIVIPTRDGYDLLKRCIDSLLAKTTYKNFEIIVIDNGSTEQKLIDYCATLAKAGKAQVLHDNGPFNYSKINNFGVAQAKGEYICLMNNDIEVISPHWLSEMLSHAARPGIGAVGAKLLFGNDTLQHAGIVCGLVDCAGHSHKGFPRNGHGYFSRTALISSFSAVTGACLLVKKSTYQQIQGLNEQDLKIAYNDVDFCLRLAEAGWRNVWTPYAELYHHESATRGYEDSPEKLARLMTEQAYMHKHWGHVLQQDPAYSPNLTLDYEDFSLAWPPRVKPLASLAVAEAN